MNRIVRTKPLLSLLTEREQEEAVGLDRGDASDRERVALGGRVLTRLWPEWRREIDLDLLDMDDPRCCILGQLWGTADYDGVALNGFTRAVRRRWQYDMSTATIGGMGFLVMPRQDGRTDYSELNAAWERVVRCHVQGCQFTEGHECDHHDADGMWIPEVPNE